MKKFKNTNVNVTKIVQRLEDNLGRFPMPSMTYIRASGFIPRVRAKLALFVGVVVVEVLLRLAVRLLPPQGKQIPDTRVFLREELVEMATAPQPRRGVDYPGFDKPLPMPASQLDRQAPSIFFDRSAGTTYQEQKEAVAKLFEKDEE